MLRYGLKMPSFIGAILRFIFSLFTKSAGDKAIDTLLQEKQDALKEVENARKVEDRYRTDPAYANELYRRFKRKDD